MGTPNVGSTSFNAYQPDTGNQSGKVGNPHNVTVEECAEMANNPERSRISADDYNKLSADEKACYELDPETGEYRLTQEVLDVLAEHGKSATHV